MKMARKDLGALAGVLVAGALLATGCSSSSGGSTSTSGTADATKPVTLNVQLFGTFGYKEAGLFADYQKLHPNITINYSSTEQEQQYYPKIQQQMAATKGVGDVYGIEVGRIADVVANQANRWVDLSTLGATDLQKNFYEWKAKAATTSDGKILGLGTDIGPIAICYRTDLFKAAGLPTDRDELAAKWTSWDQFIALGKQYEAKAPKGSHFLDTATGLYASVIGGSADQYYDSTGNTIYGSNPKVKAAWDTAVSAIKANETAKLAQFDTAWNQAFSTGSFATISCPSWMIGYIKGQAGDKGKGKWDVAKGPGVANWGGSYLGIPKNSQHQKEAYDLISWLTAPAQQVKLFQKQGSFPSSSVAASDPGVSGATDAYFNNAPIGKIFGDIAQGLPVVVNGPKSGLIQTTISAGITSVETQGKDPEKAWETTLKSVKNAVGS